MNITVKNIPDSIYRVMKREAKRKRRSLNAEIIQALETEAAEAERRRQLNDLRKELDRFAASLPPLSNNPRAGARSGSGNTHLAATLSPGGIRQSGGEA